MSISRRIFRLFANSRSSQVVFLLSNVSRSPVVMVQPVRWFSPNKDPSNEPKHFYRRPLPASCIAFATSEGRQIFKEALEMGFLESFFDLVPQFRTQAQPSYCGLSAMVMVLNSFELDPGRVWKAPWRWYHEDMLTCCLGADDLFTEGITIDQFQSIAKCNGLSVSLFYRPIGQSQICHSYRPIFAISY
ncbi:unnamed protein product [Hymenolepis diminuta]|uniref:glutathione gamma-glutamylcysteinyltransferase n=1 Tax=Hymenolepis diminuta TaxID=6216 RepID=A0A158QED0_HYMDI|nr:unnamed protein product [Hymenolepis diminuta]